MNITKVYNRFKTAEELFRCPICSMQMSFENENSLTCSKRHCFDLSKHGYVNFVPNQKRTKYTKGLFESRRCIFQSGFYDPLIKNIEGHINKHLDTLSSINILDAGCGEGFFISKLFNNNKQAKEIFAMDILKDAIILANKESSAIKWMVGDLSNIPLRSSSMDLLLNIFSPANYNEFLRILKKEGILIKVIPGEQYLKELRQYAKDQLVNQKYSNEEVFQCFYKNVVCLERDKLFYQLPVTPQQLENFIEMTPMMLDIDKSKLEDSGIKNITIDVEIAIGNMEIKND